MFTPRVILFGIALAQLTDALTFTIGVSRFGIDLESNGIAVMLYRSGGLERVLLVKGMVLLITIGLLVATAPRFPRLLDGWCRRHELGTVGIPGQQRLDPPSL